MIVSTMEHLSLKPGKYVLAVSGGVDSVVLLDLLCKNQGLDIIVAHFDHGIRQDSARDREFVQALTRGYKLPFVLGQAKLGPNASEETARETRYEFLYGVVKKTKSKGLITAYHQDDVIETAIINLLRGTNRKGLSSRLSSDKIFRPMLEIPKSDLLAYAKANKLDWHEDLTNLDTTYLRNYIRHK